jgi:hypothetical protein
MRIAVICDTQCHGGIDMTYLSAIGQYITDKQPDVIVHIGDHYDMPSLSSYDVGKKSFEGRRYIADIEAGNKGMEMLLSPIQKEQARRLMGRRKAWKPQMHFLLGNHENRISRAVENDAKLDGAIGLQDLDLAGWQTHDFLNPLFIEGVAFNHYFTTGLAGRPASTASAQLNKQHMSCIAGHQQGLQIATGKRGDGQLLTSVIAGSCYPHEEAYLGPQGNKHWRGMLICNNVEDGQFDLMPVPLKYIMDKYA